MTQSDTTFYRPRGEVIRDISKVCSHIFEGGHRCASPALRGEPLCYNHQPSRLNLPTRNEVRAAQRHLRRTFPIPRPTNHVEVQQALTVVLQAIAGNRIAPRRAGRLLAALQQLSNNLADSADRPSSTSDSAFPAAPPIERSPKVASQLPFVPATGSKTSARGRCDRQASASIASMLHVTNHV